MTRPILNEIPVDEAMKKPGLTITMDRGQWDALINAVYDFGGTLLEIVDEIPARAFRKKAE